MKVQVWTKFRKKKIWKKVKSTPSMNFGRITTSKCRGKLQKMGVLYTHSSKSPGPFPKLPKINFLKIKKFQKNWNSPIGPGVDPRLVGDRWLLPGPGSPTCGHPPAAGRRLDLSGCSHFCWILFSSYPPLLVQVVNSFSLAAAHARPTQTSFWNFKHP
jgi:hypothetical protein